MQRIALIATLACFVFSGIVQTASAQSCCNNLETLPPDGTIVNTLFINGIMVTIASAAPLIAETYNTNPIGFTGAGGATNAPLNPANVSGLRFLTTDFLASGGFTSAQPITFTFSSAVTHFGLTTLDLLENGEVAGNTVTLEAPAGGGLDTDAKAAPQGASGVDLDWQVSHPAGFTTVRLFGGPLTQNGFGIDDICIIPLTNNCGPTATSAAGSVLICPAGDAGLLSTPIMVRVIDPAGAPVPNIPRCDFWLIDCDPLNDMILCVPSVMSTNAATDTDACGDTQMLGPISAGGCADGLSVVVQGQIIQDPLTGCTTDLCLPFAIRSPDINGDLMVSIQDLAIFAQSYPPQPYSQCVDLNGDGTIGLQDLALFAAHFGHSCVVPVCP